jgi:putative ABC transport system permease protein
MILFFRFVYRNIFRHPLRNGLTALAITIAILAFGVLRTMVDAWYAGVDATSATRLVTRNAISLTFRLPLAYRNKIRQAKGVNAVSYANWFGGLYISEKNFFPQFAIDPESYLDLYPEYLLSPEERSAFLHHRNAAIAGRKLASRYGWKIGDVIPLRGTSYPGNWNFVLQGIYQGAESATDERIFFFHWDTLNEDLKKTAPSRADQVGVYIVGIENVDKAAEISREIDQIFKNSLAETLTETDKAFSLGFVSMSRTIVMATETVSFVVIAIITVVVANTMAMSTRERTREFAILKALGFGPGYIFVLIFGESLILSLSAGIAGILLSYPAADLLRSELDTILPVFNVAEKTVWMALATALLVGLLASIIPIWHAVTMPVVKGLRSIG